MDDEDQRYNVQCKLNREYTWGSSLKVSGGGEEESKKNWNFAKLTCLLKYSMFQTIHSNDQHIHILKTKNLLKAISILKFSII